MRILIVGVSVRAAAEAAIRAGYDVVALDYFGDRDLAARCPTYALRRDFALPVSAAGLATAAETIAADAVVYTSSFENHPDLIERLARGRRLLGNTAETVRRVRRFPLVAECLGRIGIPTPTTLGPGERPPDDGRRWLVKPVKSGGGHGIRPWRGEPVEPGHVLQEVVQGVPASATFVADGRTCRLLALSEQLIGHAAFGARGYRYCGSLMPLTGATPALVARVKAACAALTETFGLRGLNGLDFILAGDAIWPVEVNPRFSASMELIDWLDPAARVFQEHVAAFDAAADPRAGAAARGSPALPDGVSPAPGPRVVGKAVLFAERTATLGSTDDWLARGIRDVPWSGETVHAGQPICTMLTAADSRAACLAALERQAAALKRMIDGEPVHSDHGPIDQTGDGDERR